MALSDSERQAIATLAVARGIVDVDVAADMVRRPDASVDELRQHVGERDLVEALAAELGLAFHDFGAVDQPLRVDRGVLRRVELDTLRRNSALPMVDADGGVVAVVADPTDVDLVGLLRERYPGLRFAIGIRREIHAAVLRAEALLEEGADPSAAAAGARDREPAAPPAAAVGQRPVEEWIDASLERAVAEGASDLHLLFRSSERLLARLRVDGELREIPVPGGLRGNEIVRAVLSRTGTIDPSNDREPASGSFTYHTGGRQIDVRVEMMPQEYGPTVVARLLDSQAMQVRLDDMVYDPPVLRLMRETMRRVQGSVMLAGPTGSGKTTTLYSLLRELDPRQLHIQTVEDPVEYRLPYIGQTRVRTDLGERSITFPRALRSILRLDPDVILVGECRDQVTARTTMEAAITGHLALSTVHAPSAVGVFTRLIDIGVPSYMVSEAISLAVYQRLVKRLHGCATWEPPDDAERAQARVLGVELPDRVPRPRGCASCNHTGYRGRVAVYEALQPSPRLRAAVAEQVAGEEVHRIAEADGMRTLADAGVRLVAQGLTSWEQIVAIVDDRDAEAQRLDGDNGHAGDQGGQDDAGDVAAADAAADEGTE